MLGRVHLVVLRMHREGLIQARQAGRLGHTVALGDTPRIFECNDIISMVSYSEKEKSQTIFSTVRHCIRA